MEGAHRNKCRVWETLQFPVGAEAVLQLTWDPIKIASSCDIGASKMADIRQTWGGKDLGGGACRETPQCVANSYQTLRTAIIRAGSPKRIVPFVKRSCQACKVTH